MKHYHYHYGGLSPAQQSQKEHWQRMGSIRRCQMLLQHHIDNDIHMPRGMKTKLQQIIHDLYVEFKNEMSNNEFINLNLTPTWRKK